MKRVFCQKNSLVLLIIIAFSLIGVFMFLNESENIKYVSEGKEESSDFMKDRQSTVDVSFCLKDEAGNPLKNITYSIEYVSGERGKYNSDYGITDTTSEFNIKMHPNAQYILRLQKRNAIIKNGVEREGAKYDSVIYDEMTVYLDITEACTKEIIWEEENVINIRERNKPILIDLSKVYDVNSKSVWVELVTIYGTYIQLGYPDDNKIHWYDGEDGEYFLCLHKMNETKEDVINTYKNAYRINIKEGKIVGLEYIGGFEIFE